MNSKRLYCVASHLLHIFKNNTIEHQQRYDTQFKWHLCAYDRRNYSLLFIGRFSTHLLVLEKRKDFLTLNGHGISDARCSLWISIFFHTIFSTFAIPPSLSFFPICLPGHRISDIVKYIIICCVFVCFFRIQNTKWYDVKLPLLKYFDSIRNIKWWNSNIFTWWYGFLFHSICVRNSNRMKKSRKGKK